MGSPSNQTLAFFTTRSMLPSHCIPETAPAPAGLITPRTFKWRAMLYWSLLCKAPPSQVKGIEEQLGRLLFWHSLYVLLIGANWHRGAPLFRCIIWPASVRRKEKAQTKGRGKIGQGLNQSTAISLLHQNSQANFVLGFVVAAYRVCWLKSAISKIWL